MIDTSPCNECKLSFISHQLSLDENIHIVDPGTMIDIKATNVILLRECTSVKRITGSITEKNIKEISILLKCFETNGKVRNSQRGDSNKQHQ